MHQTISASFENDDVNKVDSHGDVHITKTQDGIVMILTGLDAQVVFDDESELFKALRNAVLEERGLL